MQNDPVNSVDPTGLEDCGRDPWCIINIGSGSRRGGVFGGGAGDGIVIEDGEVNTGGSSGGQAPPPLPQNTPTPCTFNINISSVSGQQLLDMQNEISRIFASGNFNVVFGQPGSANAGSMNLVGTPQYTGSLAAAQGTRLTVSLGWEQHSLEVENRK